MRHGNKNKNLSRTASHRKALLMNLGSQLITHKRITTTLAKARVLRTFIEPIITKTKANSSKELIMHNHRIVFSYLNDKAAVHELFTVIAPKVAARPGGYTRIIRYSISVSPKATAKRRMDNADMAMIELVDFNTIYTKEAVVKKAKTRRSRRAGGKKEDGSETSEVEAAESTEVEAKEGKAKKAAPKKVAKSKKDDKK